MPDDPDPDPDADGDRLAAAVAELYGGPPEQFTGRRGELAAAARDAGDRAAATSIGALRRPTRAAWVVNRLARTDADAPGKLAELSAALDAAQRAGEAVRLRELSAERWALLDGLTAQALDAAGVRDPPPSLRDEVGQTLAAVLADPGVAADFAAGTLTRAVQWSGFGLVTGAGGGGAGEDSPGGDDVLSAWGAPAAPAGRRTSRGASAPARDEEMAAADEVAADGVGSGPADGPRSPGGRVRPVAAGKAASAGTTTAGAAGETTRSAARGGAGGRTLRSVPSAGRQPTTAERRAEAEQQRAAEAERQAAAARRVAAEQSARRREQYAQAERALAEATAAAAEAGEAEDRLEAEVRDLEQRLARAREDLAAARMRARRADFTERRATQALERLPRP